MNRYEAMFIFPEALKEDELEASVARVREDMEKAGGAVDSTTRMGKRNFARPIRKQTAGQYVVIGFRIAGDKIVDLLTRYRLSEDIVRVQIHAAEEAVAVPAAAGGEVSDGVAQ